MPTPGRLQAHGILFLRQAPYVAREPGTGQFVLALNLLEKWTSPAGHPCSQAITAWWHGPAAESFHRLHAPELKPGCPLDVVLDSLHTQPGTGGATTLSGAIYACTLAPRAAPRPAPDAAQATAPATDSIAPQPATAQAAA